MGTKLDILNTIDEPGQLQTLSLPQLEELAGEIRERLIATVSLNGGHLASNLGVVELTLALHRVFHSPNDKIVWDVGHQSYPHKLITGRRDKFTSLRQYGGLSGYTSPEESCHDAFGAGHASTSISAATGMALARDLSGESYHVVAIIGDGALGGGMAFEALNHAGHLGTRLTVVLNDNGMAISPSVGALAKRLSRVRASPGYRRAKRDAWIVVRRLPLGARIWALGERLKNFILGLMAPTTFWREMGFEYLGPIPGHDLAQLERALLWARERGRGPVLVHVLTQKGEGYPPAEEDAVAYHGVPPKESKDSTPSYSSVFGQTVCQLLQDNPKAVAISAAMLDGTGLALAKEHYPDRVFDVGICEQHAVTMAAGLASQGFTPIVAVYSTFLQRAYDQIIHDVCIQNLPVTFAIDRAGIVGDDGKTHQGTFDISYLCAVPNMIVAAPKDEDELRHLLYTALRCGQPMAVRYPRGGGLGVPLSPSLNELPIGKGEVLREGRNLTLIALGNSVHPALEAAQMLEKQGVSARVINARFAKPLDRDLILQAAEETSRLVTVEENTLSGGFGSQVAHLLATAQSQARLLTLALPDDFIEHGPQTLLRSLYGIDASGIAHQALASFPEIAQASSLRA
ncbi:MAG: 1-deoxy-D-xylulose-5-phosphate synthase [Chloroflexi bacterium]|nr:1-deoxy-D-xylulose-5-phosphate synthase [Chloroflexota bacterium]